MKNYLFKINRQKPFSLIVVAIVLLSLIIVPLINSSTATTGNILTENFAYGNYNGWTASGTPTISEAITYSDRYSLQINGESEGLMRNFSTTYTEVWYRKYVYFDVLSNTSGAYAQFMSVHQEDYLNTNHAQVYNNGSGNYFRFNSGYWGGSNLTTIPVLEDTWYCVEIHELLYPNKCELYVNSSMIAQSSGPDSASGDFIGINTGITESVGTYTYYVDNIDVSTTQNGEEAYTLTEPIEFNIATFHYDSGDLSGVSNYDTDRWQLFKVVSAVDDEFSLTKVQLRLSDRNACNGSLWMNITGVDGVYGTSGAINSTVFATSDENYANASAVYNSFSWLNFTFSGANKILLKNNTVYGWQVWTDGIGFDGDNSILVYLQTSANTANSYEGDFGKNVTREGAGIGAYYFDVFGESDVLITYSPSIVSTRYNQTVAGNSTLFTVTANMTYGGSLNNAWLETNATGTLENKTAVSVSGSYQSVNDTALMPDVGDYITSRWHVNSTTGNITTSAWMNFTLNILTYSNLRAVGNTIQDENGTIVQLNGFNYDISLDYAGFSYIKPDGTIVWNSYNATIIDQMLSAINQTGANALRVGFGMDRILHNTDNNQIHMRNFIQNAWQYGIYVEMVPHVDNSSTEHSFDDMPWKISDSINILSPEDFANAWGNVSDLYKNETNVLFYLWNEPQGDQTEYFAGAQLAVNAIRATGATNVIVLSKGYGIGIDYNWPSSNGNVSWITQFPITDPDLNLAYSFHLYATDFYTSDGWTRISNVDSLDWALDYLGVYDVTPLYPVICGEIGWNLAQTNQTAEGEWFTNMLNLLGNHSIAGIQQWTWRSTTVFRALNTSGTNYDLSTGGLEFARWMNNESSEPEPTPTSSPSPSSSVPAVVPSVLPSETPFVVPSDDGVTPSSSVPVFVVDWFSANFVVVGVVVAVAVFVVVTLLLAKKH
ncbi:MAG: cellulase family glycosylhydrolase [Candidatus Bathyarchaeia archaeon]|jgi:hypothetical protein